MNGDSSRMIAEIRAAINKGTLTHSEIERRLEATIAAETDKEDSPADMELIRVCQSLLWEFDTHGQEELADDTEQSLAAFKAKEATSVKVKGTRFILRTVAVAAAVLVAGFSIDALFRHESLQGSSTDDGQQYVISGHEINPGTVSEGKDDTGVMEPQSISTQSLDDAIEVLGFTPAMPQWVPDGWKAPSYYASRATSDERFILIYSRDEQEYNLVFQVTYYQEAERAAAAFEQNKEGKEITLPDGRSLYMSENYDDTTCIWYEGLACYNLMGPESSETFIRIIESVKESSK